MADHLALAPFAGAHPPNRANRPVGPDLTDAFRSRLPASLLELWRRHGLGFYGDRGLALVDPRAWQPVLDRWIVSPPDEVDRVPIGLTPFGLILYYRRLTPTDEDVAFQDPHTRSTDVLAWSLETFFNVFLLEQSSLDALIPPAMLDVARAECGALSFGECYEPNQTLFAMQMLKFDRVDALAMHRRLRDAVNPTRGEPNPVTVRDALPEPYRSAFDDVAEGDVVAGLYLSRYIDWYRLLALSPDGRYRLLFWKIHHKTGRREDVRFYDGRYGVRRDGAGDTHLSLDIRLGADSLGSDARDADLILSSAGGVTRLLRADELRDIARAIARAGRLGRSEYYFRRTRLDDAAPGDESDGEIVPADSDGLPAALRTLL